MRTHTLYMILIPVSEYIYIGTIVNMLARLFLTSMVLGLVLYPTASKAAMDFGGIFSESALDAELMREAQEEAQFRFFNLSATSFSGFWANGGNVTTVALMLGKFFFLILIGVFLYVYVDPYSGKSSSKNDHTFGSDYYADHKQDVADYYYYEQDAVNVVKR